MMEESAEPAPSLFQDWNKKLQYLQDKASYYVGYRWIAFTVLLALYLVRVFLLDAFHIVTYGLGIYLLNYFIGFLSPMEDPSDPDAPMLPTKNSDEFRPFTRSLPEYKFWRSATAAVVGATFMTFFSFFDVPVYVPILVLYFIALFAAQMQGRIRHMWKHKYLPWTTGKQKYAAKNSK